LCALDSIEVERGLDSERLRLWEAYTLRGLDSESLLRRNSIASELERTILQEEISWRQKSKVLWLKAGDKCTKFFHQIANSNIRSNSIESLSVNGHQRPNCSILWVSFFWATQLEAQVGWYCFQLLIPGVGCNAPLLQKA
jgi:hypothetical protein